MRRLWFVVDGCGGAGTQTLVDSVMEAQNNLKEAGSQTEIEEVAADKG